MMGDGALIPPKTEDQIAALARIETLLALIDGWVDTVTDRAVSRIPTKDAIGEMVRRNRAAGRPGEKALAGLIGIEARPRRLREAAAMWRAIDDAVGSDVRDSLWAHPDVLPTSSDIDDPSALIVRLTGPKPAPDAIDDELRRILDDGAVDGEKPRRARCDTLAGCSSRSIQQYRSCGAIIRRRKRGLIPFLFGSTI
jgi:hypothetical protein